MPEPILPTAGESSRRRLHYERAAIGVMGSWNPDASFANLKDNDFTEVQNLRMPTGGGYECRTGYKKYIDDNDGFSYSSLEILCKAEYRHKVDAVDVLFDMTVYQVGGDIFVSAINRGPIPGSTLWPVQYAIKTIPIPAAPVPNAITTVTDTLPTSLPQIAGATQWGSFLAITVFGVGTFAIYPQDALADIWILRELGKNLANTPWELNFAADTTGDMLLTSFTDVVNGRTHAITPAPAVDFTTKQSQLIPPYLFTRQPLNMKYFLSSNAAFTRSPNKLFEWSINDKTTADSASEGRSSTHLQTRAWGYRFVFIRTFTDPRGNKVKFRSQASVDIWVPNMIYCPPQPYAAALPPPDTLTTVQTWLSIGDPLPLTGGGPRFLFGSSSYVWETVMPTSSDMIDLEKSFLQYVGQTWGIGVVVDNKPTGIDEETWLPAMWWMGFRRVWDTQEFIKWQGTFQDAWFKAIPASILKSAPLTKFKWTDFSTTDGSTTNPDFPTDVTEIEVYRTAWSDGDAKLTDGDPAFQPHLYGYVGSIKPDSDFIDDVMDEVIDFGKQPSDYDGFLEGQFSGQVIREYSGKLALGNCSTGYYAFAPWSLYQLIAYNRGVAAASPYTTTELTSIAADMLPSTFLAIQYIDEEGNLSDLIRLTNPTWTITASALGISDFQIVIPQGYDPNITGINVWFSYYNGGPRLYKFIKNVAPDAGYISINTTDITAISPSSPTLLHNTKTIIEGGEVMWSDVNDMFAWDPVNVRIVRKTGNITALETVVGELMIFSDTATDYDNLNGVDPRGEEVSKWIGCVGRFAYCKVDKVVFILTANGLFFAEPGGVVPFPANVQSVVLDYINETIPLVPDMANARRATMGYDAKRYELWLYFPSSFNLGGSLPDRLIIYKFFNPDISHSSVQNFVNYRFDLLLESDEESAFPSGTQNMPIFQTTQDGKLFVSYKSLSPNETDFEITTLDCDTDAQWLGVTNLEHVYGLGEMNIMKMMRSLMVAGDFDCDLSVRHSSPSQVVIPNPVSGWINPAVPSHAMNLLPARYNAIRPHRIGGTEMGTSSVIETTSYTPVVRLQTLPNGVAHVVKYKAIDLEYQILHNHPA